MIEFLMSLKNDAIRYPFTAFGLVCCFLLLTAITVSLIVDMFLCGCQ